MGVIVPIARVKKPMKKMQRNLLMKNSVSITGGTINTQTSGHLLIILTKKPLSLNGIK